MAADIYRHSFSRNNRVILTQTRKFCSFAMSESFKISFWQLPVKFRFQTALRAVTKECATWGCLFVVFLRLQFLAMHILSSLGDTDSCFSGSSGNFLFELLVIEFWKLNYWLYWPSTKYRQYQYRLKKLYRSGSDLDVFAQSL